MAIDATGAPTSLGIPKFNTAVDAPTGKGSNAQMDSIDALIVADRASIAAKIDKPAGIASGETAVWNGASFDRSSVTRLGISSIASGAPTGSKFVRDDGVLAVPGGLGSLVGFQVFTTNGTYTPTTGTTRVFVECVGGGGGGGGAPLSANARGGGGGAGAYAASLLTSAFSGVTVTIGGGGAGNLNAAGGSGGDTSFGALVIGKGGLGGTNGVASTNVIGGGGGSASASTGSLKIDGQDGQIATVAGGSMSGGDGGDSRLGTGGRGLMAAGAGQGGGKYGGGGGGAFETGSASNRTGGAGAQGVCLIWEYA